MIKEIMNMDNMQNSTVEQNMYGYEQTVNYGYSTNAVQMPNAVTGKIANMVTASAVIWICIAIYQILVGLVFLIFGVGITTIACGCWNIYACINNFKHASFVRNCNNPYDGQAIVASYDKALTSNIIFLFINLFLGGGLGVIGVIFDMILRSYVLKNRHYLGA